MTVPRSGFPDTVGSLSNSGSTEVTVTAMPENGDENANRIYVGPGETTDGVSKIVDNHPYDSVTASFDRNGRTTETENPDKNESKRYRHRGNLIEGAVVFTKSELRDFLNNL